MAGLQFGRSQDGKLVELALNADGTLKHKPVVTFEQSIANAAASATSTLDADLGEEWHQYTILTARKAGVLSAGEVFEIWFSTDGVTYQSAAGAYAVNSIAWTNVANAHIGLNGRVHGRYVRVRHTNGATQQPSSAKLFLTAAPY